MSDPLLPIQRILPERRVNVRRLEDRGDESESPPPEPLRHETEAGLPVPTVTSASPPGPDPHDPMDISAAFATQVLGQPGQRRGLRGGPEILDKARSAYLEAEYSGGADRRLPPGVVAETEI